MAGPKKKPTSKGAAPTTPHETSVVGNNTSKTAPGELKPLNFKRSPEFIKEFKTFAASHEMKLSELLEEAFYYYKEHKGGK
ncbi:hypothetical protein [Vibrio parahaemolyticus]|uniref:hypothetical protein n=1 Tax=Vibrio parahaemolyticus TaxID=670 RepID=UPI000D52F89C|nr:hypothetical protein [Vibrio parahaemolyticus]AWG87355.1 unknow [Vibrio parahaemolyticus]